MWLMQIYIIKEGLLHFFVVEYVCLVFCKKKAAGIPAAFYI